MQTEEDIEDLESESDSDEIFPKRFSLPRAEERGTFFVYQRELTPGTRLEQYEILSVLGSGGFGITYLAKDLFLNRTVVIKENFPANYSYRDPLTGHILANNPNDQENYAWSLKSFLTEARTLAKLDHPGIVKVLSVFEANGTAYFAMERISGVPLDYLSEQLQNSDQPPYSEDEMKGLLIRLLKILQYLHSQKIFHRDIKPANILLTEAGVPVLIDFGAARHMRKINLATLLSTQGYSSPEQALGQAQIGAWSDVYSVGATFYTILTGRPPERAEGRLFDDSMIPLSEEPEVKSRYSQELLKTLDKALSPKIADRYQSADEWLQDLYAIYGTDEAAIIQITREDIRQARGALSHLTKLTDTLTGANSKTRPYVILLLIASFSILIGIGAFYLASCFFDDDAEELRLTNARTQPIPMLVSQKEDTLNSYRSLESIVIPELELSEETSLEVKEISSFPLRLDNPILSKKDMTDPFPKQLLISCIYLRVKAVQPDSKEIYLSIRDTDGQLICRSINPVPNFIVTDQSSSSFFFPSLPVLDTSKTYKYCFESLSGKAQPVQLSCYKNEVEDDVKTVHPRLRIVGNIPDEKKPSLLPEGYEEMKSVVAYPKSFSMSPLFATQEQIEEKLDAIKLLAKEGYPLAQYLLGKYILSSNDYESEDAEKGVEWLYRAAVGGSYRAMREMGIQLLDVPGYFPDFPSLPPIARRDYAQAAHFLRQAAQYNDKESIYLLSLMYTQGWGVQISPRITKLLQNRLGSLYQNVSCTPDCTIVGLWLPDMPPSNEPTAIRCIVPPTKSGLMPAVTLLNTSHKNSFSYIAVKISRLDKEIVNYKCNVTVLPGERSAPIELTDDDIDPASITTHAPYIVGIMLDPENSSGIVEIDIPPKEKEES